MTGAITQFNGPNVTLAGGSALKKFMENTAVAAKKKIEETGSVEGFKAGFVSADGEISVKITSKAMVEESGRSGYGLFYELQTTDQGVGVGGGGGVEGVTASGEEVDNFLSSMTTMNDAIGTKSGTATDEEILESMKDSMPPDQYEKARQRMKESKAADETQQKELSGKTSSPASTATSRLDRMKAQSEEGARLAERLLKQVASGHSSRSDDAATWIAQSATEKPAPAPYKPIDLKA